jgi:transposase
MKTENWLLCHVHAYNYYGGVTRLLIPDNTKTAVIQNTRYDTILNKSYQELSDHYGTAIVPARPKAPDDKAAAEGSVKFVSTWITAALRDRKLFSLAEAREAVAEKLEELNSRPFKKRPGNRNRAFDEEEKEFLQPLPETPYEPAIWLNPKVGTDYLVTDGINKYSVPYDLIGEIVDVRVARNTVEVFYHNARVAAHVRKVSFQRDPITKPEHMPEAHRKYLHYNKEEFEAWAVTVGPNTEKVVHHFLTDGKEAEQGYKSCASLTKLEKSYSAKRLEDACERVLALASAPTIRNITLLIKTAPARKEPVQSEAASIHREAASHGITRGAAYYSRGGQHHE